MRTFIAVEIGEPLETAFDDLVRRWVRRAPGSRWVRRSSFHLTLAFLGEVPDAQVPRISAALSRVVRDHAAHDLGVQGGGTFGPLECPKVLWAGVSGAVDRLEALQLAVVRELAPLGVAPDHERYLPHITLARAKSPLGDPALSGCADALRDIRLGSLPVREVALLESETTPGGMRYRSVWTGALRAEGPPR